MEKVNSTFWFKNPYYENNGVKEQFVTVILEINYRTRTYSIKPYCGTVSNGFMFEQSSHKNRMWKAILKSIGEAIDYANEELNNTPI